MISQSSLELTSRIWSKFPPRK